MVEPYVLEHPLQLLGESDPDLVRLAHHLLPLTVIRLAAIIIIHIFSWSTGIHYRDFLQHFLWQMTTLSSALMPKIVLQVNFLEKPTNAFVSV